MTSDAMNCDQDWRWSGEKSSWPSLPGVLETVVGKAVLVQRE
jgi:hypothetical protein